ncbi:MAG: hypothetical protein ACOCUI_00485 [bacterium]
MIYIVILLIVGILISITSNIYNTIFKRNRKDIRVDLCKTYRMEEEVEERDFNKKWNDPKLRWVFHKRNNLTRKFLRSLATRIKHNTNAILVFAGKPNSGKSEGANSIALMWIRMYYKLKNKLPKVHLAFSNSDFNSSLRKMKEGDIGVRDESPKVEGSGSYSIKAHIDNLTKIVRAKQISFIFVSPEIIKAKVVNYYLQAAGKCIPKRETRYILYNDDLKPLGHVIIPLHNNNKYRKKYENLKHKNIDKLINKGGSVTNEIDGDKLEQDAQRLKEFCLPYQTYSTTKIKSLCTLYNTKQRKNGHPEKAITGRVGYMRQVQALASLYLKIQIKGLDVDIDGNGNDKKKNNDITFEEIDTSNHIDFGSFVYTTIKDKDKALIGREIALGESNRNIEKNYPSLGRHKIITIGKELRSQSNTKTGLGYLFEKYLALYHYDIPKKDLNIACKGEGTDKDGNQFPDIHYNDILATVKLRFNTDKKHVFSQRNDFYPAYRIAKKENRKYDFIFHNLAWNTNIRFTKLDPNKDDEVIIHKNKKKKLKF